MIIDINYCGCICAIIIKHKLSGEIFEAVDLVSGEAVAIKAESATQPKQVDAFFNSFDTKYLSKG